MDNLFIESELIDKTQNILMKIETYLIKIYLFDKA